MTDRLTYAASNTIGMILFKDPNRGALEDSIVESGVAIVDFSSLDYVNMFWFFKYPCYTSRNEQR